MNTPNQANAIAFMTPWTKPADAWSHRKAAEMHKDGMPAGKIISHLEAYGIGRESARSLIRELKNAK